MGKPKVLVIQTGGTIGQERGKDGVFRPSSKQYINVVSGLDKLADLSIERPANIDSTNMTTDHRADLAKMIYENHMKYDGFVVVHGTDTMADTACALNYMVQNLGKPIILTGSQISCFEPGSDGPRNLYNAIKAATMDIGEVCVAFGDYILRGVKAIKMNEQGMNAFDSPRVQPIAELGIDIFLASHRIKRHHGDPHLFREFDCQIESYRQASGTNTGIFEKYIADDDIHGVIIEGFGAGNIQDRLIPAIASATEKGKPVVVVTNCLLGAADMGIYEVGSKPLAAGAISAGDMTLECASQKLMYVLGRANRQAHQGRERIDYIRNLIHHDYGKDISVTEKRM